MSSTRMVIPASGQIRGGALSCLLAEVKPTQNYLGLPCKVKLAQGRAIAIIGSSGQVGLPTVKALLASGTHTITAVQRIEATSTFSPEVIVKSGNLEDESFLASTFQGHDAVVLMPPLPQLVSLQEPAVRAAAKAGVPYILPAEFGPDPFASQLIEENQLLQDKKKICDLIEKLGVSSWISVAVAKIWTGAVGKVDTSSVAQTGQATAAVLGLPGQDLSRHKNKAFYAPSFL
ncbi:hypothetical protein FGADI_1226 [Fusarium gaditjirri]|uniref:NmrA-like domain-containing protein n=1 Tax=Fusarium gaditjirri TaxID=282569 RepID=A0A8H4TLQ0_9HYPO|nr:hypothetical protein FGADI_1226 [Fusarium gaditjirri]